MSNTEYEIINHEHNYRIFLVNILYRTPHIHKDYEINLLLDGQLQFNCQNEIHHLKPGDIFVVNPFHSHELKADAPCLVLSLQITSAIFANLIPQFESLEFNRLSPEDPTIQEQIRCQLIRLAQIHYENQEFAALEANIAIQQIFLDLLRHHPYHLLNPRELSQARAKTTRMRGIMHYIDENYREKLLLSDIAEREGLDLYYLSRLFKDTFGISFQNYLSKIRCEYARQLLLLTDRSLLDISMSCGFSDPKYFNKGFKEQYGCTPKEYRKRFDDAQLNQQQSQLLSTQEFLSDQASLVTLAKYQ